jgi:hypothetical protein
MDTAINGGDLAMAANGRPYSVEGLDEIFQRAAIRLTVPAGSFCYDASLGSRLGTLTGKEPDPDATALSLAQDALRPMPGMVVKSAEFKAGTPNKVVVELSFNGALKKIEVTCSG